MGCKDGELYCGDPRCTPNCASCQPQPIHTGVFTFIVFFLIFMFLLFAYMLFLSYGPELVKDIKSYQVQTPAIPTP